MERATVAIYEERGDRWAAGVRAERRQAAEAFAAEVPMGMPRIDLGCGAGRYTASLGSPCVALDAARSMLEMCRAAAPDALLVRADLEQLPFGRGTLDGAWANMSYLHLPRKKLPCALADLHRSMRVGAPLDIQVLRGEFEGTGLTDDRVGGRFFAAWSHDMLVHVLVGAGFEVVHSEVVADEGSDHRVEGLLRARAERARTVPDMVGPGMRVLVCGLAPSIEAADAGVGFSGPGDRFWPAALAAGLVSDDRDARRALSSHRVGIADVVKRTAASISDIGPDEYRSAAPRLEALVSWLEPAAVCFIGLEGWRAITDPAAQPGTQQLLFGGRPVYVTPSMSVAFDDISLEELARHLGLAASLADSARR